MNEDEFTMEEAFRRLFTCPAVANFPRTKGNEYPLAYCVVQPRCSKGCCYTCKKMHCMSKCLRTLVAEKQ